MKRQSLALFTNAKSWMPVASGEATLALSLKQKRLRMDFDFKGGGGFAVARRVVRRAMPDTFQIGFRWKGRGPVNHLELKLVDETGTNVWRREWRDVEFTGRWRSIVVSSRDLPFAWGPAGGGAMTQLGAVEFAIVAKDGGAGQVWISDCWIEDQSFAARPKVMRSLASPHGMQLDAGAARTLGGLIIEWKSGAPAEGFRVLGSKNGKRWHALYEAKRAAGARSFVYLPDTTTRLLRIESGGAEVKTVHVQSFEFSRSAEAFWHHVAKACPRGWHPRWLAREQSLWTPFGSPQDRDCALMNEQGMVELSEGACSLEPLLFINGKLVTWADVMIEQALLDGWQPVPSVTWQTKAWTLEVRGEGLANDGRRVRYRFTNHSRHRAEGCVFVVVRPVQVTPPWQHFRNVGGLALIRQLCWDGKSVRVNGSFHIHALDEARFGAMTFDEGIIAEQLASGALPDATEVEDRHGFASGALRFAFSLKPGESKEFGVATTTDEAPAFDWSGKLNPQRWQCGGWGGEALRAMHTATAQVLITCSGPALQPGPRRYTRSWIRDATIMSAALLRAGCAEEVRDFVEWYAPHQREDGFVPCCVDRDGADELVEHDSHGQLIALIADYCRCTGDLTLAKKHWPHIASAVKFIERSLEADGLMPVSASHEGYLAHPVHSFWDGFWTWRGLRDAVWLSSMLKKRGGWTRLAKRAGASVLEAIERTRAAKQLEYIPGSVEWADFDPTATANAMTLLDVPDELNREAIDWTFEKYLIDWHRKRTGELPWTNYTPYEIRIIGALVRLGRRDAALELLRFFLSDRRPLAWNQWPEIVWRDPLAPAHIGDVPHTWIAAEYALAVRSLFVFEDETRQQLVLAAGVAREWMGGEGITLESVRTSFGLLSLRLQQTNDALSCHISGTVRVPSGGVVLRPPLTGPIRRVLLNGKTHVEFNEHEVVVRSLPVRILICP